MKCFILKTLILKKYAMISHIFPLRREEKLTSHGLILAYTQNTKKKKNTLREKFLVTSYFMSSTLKFLIRMFISSILLIRYLIISVCRQNFIIMRSLNFS